MITYLDRSNLYASNVFLDGSNLYINAGDITLAQVSSSGTGIVYARTIGASINTSQYSAFYNLNFTPVNGDVVELPTIWQGSLISVDPTGLMTFAPALPNGTQIPRRSYQVSTDTWFQDTVTVNDGAGTGVLSLPQVATAGAGAIIPRTTGDGALTLQVVTSSGAGSVAPRPSGSGNITLQQVSTSGSGSVAVIIAGTGAMALPQVATTGAGAVFEVITGNGSMTIPGINTSGVGSVTATSAGVGSLFLQPVTVAGSGTVVSRDLPVITDGGDLSITIPFYGIAVCTDYPAVAAWLASFTSSVPVSNNAPLLPLAANSPVPVVFKATNSFGTTTLQRMLTVTVAAATAQLVPNQADLRLEFPYFQNLALFPYQNLDQAIQGALCSMPPTQYGRLQGSCRLRAIYLLAAHMLFIQRQARVGGAPGVVLSSTIDKVSVQNMAPPAKSMWSYWLSQSPYGVELQGMLSTKAAGGFYIPGSLERAGFRKGGGSF